MTETADAVTGVDDVQRGPDGRPIEQRWARPDDQGGPVLVPLPVMTDVQVAGLTDHDFAHRLALKRGEAVFLPGFCESCARIARAAG